MGLLEHALAVHMKAGDTFPANQIEAGWERSLLSLQILDGGTRGGRVAVIASA